MTLKALPSSLVSRYSAICRALITVVMITSWSVTTTHCAFAAAATAISAQTTPPANVQDECPMHAAKRAQAPQPEKKGGCHDVLCCKNLPAAKANTCAFVAKSLTSSQRTVDWPNQYKPLRPIRSTVLSRFLDTGPPGIDQFTELVLQRSIPAHAPPTLVI